MRRQAYGAVWVQIRQMVPEVSSDTGSLPLAMRTWSAEPQTENRIRARTYGTGVSKALNRDASTVTTMLTG
jgi:hypothetical protein